MAVKCGWASIDERGKVSGGKAGDQTGKEVRTGNWYDFGQTAVYRWKSRDKAKKYAKCIESLCSNPADGYDQGQRKTLNSELKKIHWKYQDLKVKCECDCSALAVAGVNCVAGKELLSPKLYTGNLGEALMKTGLFEKLTAKKYCDSSDYLMAGDIINKPNSHVIIALGNGSKAVAKKTTAKKTEKKATAKKKPLKVGAKIKIKSGAKQYGKSAGFAPQVYKTSYYVTQISGKRLVFSTKGGTVIGAIKISDCVVV